jgi:hypothetical protein
VAAAVKGLRAAGKVDGGMVGPVAALALTAARLVDEAVSGDTKAYAIAQLLRSYLAVLATLQAVTADPMGDDGYAELMLAIAGASDGIVTDGMGGTLWQPNWGVPRPEGL